MKHAPLNAHTSGVLEYNETPSEVHQIWLTPLWDRMSKLAEGGGTLWDGKCSSSQRISILRSSTKTFAGINFRESPISKISRELIFANRHFRESEKEYSFANSVKIREIREIFFPQKFLPLRYTLLLLKNTKFNILCFTFIQTKASGRLLDKCLSFCNERFL